MKKAVAQAKQALRAKPPQSPIPPEDWLSTGSTLLNLSCSGRRSGGYCKGIYVWLVGDSESGKTWTAYTCLAEAAMNKRFDDYRFIVHQAEDGALFDVEHFFGKRVAERIEYLHTRTSEEFYFQLDDAHNAGKPFIYILDSQDALDTKDDEKKFKKNKAARRGTGKQQETGTFGTSKAKMNSSFLRRAVGRLRETGSILIIISQSRENIGFGATYNPKTAGGGKALKFYAHLELWTSIYKNIKRTVMGKKRQLGIICKIEVKKNRLLGRKYTVNIPLYWSHGVDDVGACVDYLVEEGYWKGNEESATVDAPEFDYKGSKEKLIKLVEDGGREQELQLLVQRVWKEIVAKSCVDRKRRYQ